jgi:LCP family protein required for cell wall assembly
MSDGPPGGKPDYKVYRSRRRLLDSIRPQDALDGLRRMRRDREPGERRRFRLGGGRPRSWPKRVAIALAVAIAAWVALSLVLFFVSAQSEKGVSAATERALSGKGSLLGGSTILVLGSDQRSEATAEPGSGGPGRADSIMLLHAGFGSVRRLSILRDSLADIPGAGQQKINAAYAIGGPALTVRTVEGFMGNDLEIDHIVEINFEDFPELIDTLGGIEVTLKRCVSSQPFGGRRFRLRKGTHELNGRQALAFARVRKNRCSQGEDDRARAGRQQQVLQAIRSKVLSPATFFRLPWVSWQAPKTLRTDMGGAALFGLFVDLTTGGSGETRVLKPFNINGPGGSVLVSEDEKSRELERLLGE